jgi:hypothetical protein
MVQRAFLSDVGSAGSCSIYKDDVEEHSDFAIQVCNEKLLYVKHRQDGRNEYKWKSQEPHDYLDCMSMCYAVATSQGLSSGNNLRDSSLSLSNKRKTLMKKMKKPKIKII